jgi:hypothetical protein
MLAPKGNQNAKGNVGGTGRLPVYTPGSFVASVTTEREIAAVLGNSDRTLRRWATERRGIEPMTNAYPPAQPENAVA